MEAARIQKILAFTAIVAALAAGSGLALAMTACRWTIGGSRSPLGQNAFLYTNEAITFALFLVIPCMFAAKRTDAGRTPATRFPTRIHAIWPVAAAVAALPAFCWAAWLSNLAIAAVMPMLWFQVVMLLFAAGMAFYLSRGPVGRQVAVLSIATGLMMGGPMLLYLQGEFLPGHFSKWSAAVPGFDVFSLSAAAPPEGLAAAEMLYLLATVVLVLAGVLSPIDGNSSATGQRGEIAAPDPR